MSVLGVASMAWAGFVLLRFLAVPWAARWADAKLNSAGTPTAAVVRAVAMTSLTGFLSVASLMVGIGTTLSLAVVAYVNAAGGATLEEAREALGRVGEIHDFVGRLSASVGVAVTVVLILGLAFHAYRGGGKRLSDLIAREVKRLRNGDLEYRAPNETMQLLTVRIKDLQRAADSPSTSEEDRGRLRAKIDELRNYRDVADVERRIDLSPERLSGELSRCGRTLLFVSSAGMLRSLKGLGKVSAAVGLLLLLPASMSVGVAEIQDATDKRTVDLKTAVDSLELQRDREQVEKAFKSLPTVPEPSEGDSDDEEAPSEADPQDGEQRSGAHPDDEELIDGIASIFEAEAFYVRYLKDFEARPVRFDEATAGSLTRNRILRAWSANSPTHSAEVSVDPLQERVVELGTGPTRPRKPVTKYGERFRQYAGAVISRLAPEVKRGLRGELAAYWNSFQQAEDPRDLRALLGADLVGHVFGGWTPGGWREVFLKDLSVELTTDAAGALLRTESQRLTVALVEAQGVRTALSRVSEARPPLGSNAMKAVREAAMAAPELDRVRIEPGFLRRASRPEIDWVSTFEDRFPGEAPRSRDYARLHHSPNVGGVLVGRPPKAGPALWAKRLEWRPKNGSVEFHLLESDGARRRLGRYDPAIVHSALGYAADGRVTAVTILPSPPLVDLRILVHPALVGTHLGCSAIGLDLLAGEAGRRNPELRELRRAAVSEVFGQQQAYERAWAIRLRLLSTVSPTERHYNGLKSTLRDDLERRAENTLRSTDLKSMWPIKSDFGFLKSRPDLYDERLVDDLLSCGSAERVSELDRCLQASASGERYGSDWSASWATPFFEMTEVSGVRERRWSVDRGFGFMTSDRLLGPFRFIVQVVFSRWNQESHSDWEIVAEPPSHEFPAVEDALRKEIVSWRDGKHADGEGVRRILADMAEFTHLQRLFRALLDGQLIVGEMDLESLAEHAAGVGEPVGRAETPAWLPKPRLTRHLVEKLRLASNSDLEAALLLGEIRRRRAQIDLAGQAQILEKLLSEGCPAAEE